MNMNFDIQKNTAINNSFRVSKVQADFDVSPEHLNERFQGTIEIPETWNIGVIVGGSGTGKSTIAKKLFADQYISGFEYTHSSVIDDMPQNAKVDDIEKMFYACGFGSVPSWLKPYSVLSEGEKMRVNLARALLEREFVCFDEFTSVVDRRVAETACIAIEKAVRRTGKQFVAVTCHYDVLEWLRPDWVFDTNEMRSFFGTSRAPKNHSPSENADVMNGANLAVITI